MPRLLVGFILGFVISIPLGPLGAYMIATMQERGFWTDLTIGLFDALVDMFFCRLSLYVMILVINIPVFHFIIKINGLIVLLYLYGRHLFSLRNKLLSEGKIERLAQKALKTNKFIHHFKNAFIVFIFALSNPTRWASSFIFTITIICLGIQILKEFATIVF